MHRSRQGILFDKKKYEEFLKNIDYLETTKNLRAIMLALKIYAEKRGAVCYLKNEIIYAVVSFLNNPCLDTAVTFIEVAPFSVTLFVTKGDTAYSEEVWRKIMTGLNLGPKIECG